MIDSLTPKHERENVIVPLDPGRQLTHLGTVRFRNTSRAFGIATDDRLRHLHVLGKTGVGKSTLLANLILQDIRAGRGCMLIDPHGELVDTVVNCLSGCERSRVDVFDRASHHRVNPFRDGPRRVESGPEVASSLISIFKSLWPDSWGPRLEHILRAGVLAVHWHPEASVSLLVRFLTSDLVRERLLPRVHDRAVQEFWRFEFPGYGPRLQAEATAPVLNKLGAVVLDSRLRERLSGARSNLSAHELLRSNRVLLAKVSSVDFGDDGSRLLGALMINQLQLSAWKLRKTSFFALYVDEAQRFVTPRLAIILSEARKFGLSLVLAHQYLGQLSDVVRDAVLGNVGSKILFRLGAGDAEMLACDLVPTFTASDLTTLGRGEAIMQLTANGLPLRPIRAHTPKLPH